MFPSIISADQLKGILHKKETVIIDCRFYLADTHAGQKEYAHSHIPGAFYAHLDRDLSGEIILGKTGRHPFPEVEIFAKKCGQWGIDDDAQVVVYDQSHGGIAARLWFLLKWLGHGKVAVLDGGWKHWSENGFPISSERPAISEKTFHPKPKNGWLVQVKKMEQLYADRTFLLVDSRAAERYRGEKEPIDPVAGHIPGAVSAPFLDNLDGDGLFLKKEKLKKRFENLLAGQPLENTVFYCGSGITACHNLLALDYIGMVGAKLFPGSWSEWIVDEKRPIRVVGSQ